MNSNKYFCDSLDFTSMGLANLSFGLKVSKSCRVCLSPTRPSNHEWILWTEKPLQKCFNRIEIRVQRVTSVTSAFYLKSPLSHVHMPTLIQSDFSHVLLLWICNFWSNMEIQIYHSRPMHIHILISYMRCIIYILGCPIDQLVASRSLTV